MTSLKTSIKTITYLSDIGCLEIQGPVEKGKTTHIEPVNLLFPVLRCIENERGKANVNTFRCSLSPPKIIF
jgi:hypothetical protein